MTKSEKLFAEAKKHIPGGVNSPVRAFGSVGTYPRFIREAHGAYLTDVDGKEYLDFVCSWGPMILGHDREEVRLAVVDAVSRGLSFGAATEIEVEMAEQVCRMSPTVEMVRMVSSGTEAVMSALRLARGYTGRDKIIKFDGCYHGHSDCLLVQAGSGVMTSGVPGSAGVPLGCTENTLCAVYNDLGSVRDLFDANPGQIAAIVVEPVAANMGVVTPEPEFLPGLRAMCDEFGSLLIFDEVITGFRLCAGGAAQYYGVQPDITTFGKIIGAGMPVGAYGGRREIMERVAPLGSVYQAGTLSGNPVAMAAGLTQLRLLESHPEWYEELNRTGDWFYGEVERLLRRAGLPYPVNHVGSLGSIFFTPAPVRNDRDAKTADTAAYGAYCRYMLGQGIYLAPSQFEAMFLSMAHRREELCRTLLLMEAWFGGENREKGEMPG